MRKAAIAFGCFLVVFVLGAGTCLPGICGCAFSWFPPSWEERITLPALLAEVMGFAGCAFSGLVWLVLLAKKETKKSYRV